MVKYVFVKENLYSEDYKNKEKYDLYSKKMKDRDLCGTRYKNKDKKEPRFVFEKEDKETRGIKNL